MAQILDIYNTKSDELYNTISPYTNYGGSTGPKQPFVYIRPSDSTSIRNLTKYDTQILPEGSTVRDIERVGDYLATGNGILFLGMQAILQQQNSFNETRLYNPASVLLATAKPASLGLLDYPTRHLKTSGGILNALLSTLDIETNQTDSTPIDGTATGEQGGLAWSTYAGIRGGARAGVVRLNTANAAMTNFDKEWVATTQSSTGGTNGGFLANLGTTLVNKLKSLIPSTNPLGILTSNTNGTKWEYRPEYSTDKAGAYYRFLSDGFGIFNISTRATSEFYNIGVTESSETTIKTVKNFHKYYPVVSSGDSTTGLLYATPEKIKNTTDGGTEENEIGTDGGLRSKYDRMVTAIKNPPPKYSQFRASLEMYTEIKSETRNGSDISYSTYKDIPNSGSGDQKYQAALKSDKAITIDDMMFSKIDTSTGKYGSDGYNKYYPIESGSRGTVPSILKIDNTNQSKDVIFFYFFDLVNNVYIPFRATINGVTDQHSAEWEDITYLGRADKLFLYKGFSRDVNLSFTVYANSPEELIPMWTRINYLVGLVRPSKYTSTALSTGELSEQTSGTESRFIYPPMITIRVGDMFVDQPCIIASISTSIPDDANWESYRSDGTYSYIYGYDYKNKTVKSQTLEADDVFKSRQLPMKADIALSLRLLEKERAETKADHYGFNLTI